ncbi:putative DNA polymerase I [Actinoplanes missouriensis 431]|uniref:DNA-directed DNA polymerase n=1 Tax=Actinoplanes missouriensis (strain ATCC 14538 / DSM 43046 / CBS 188.64 / JCM 3121 / NBRC 102363 / NCIMB 12654 / NRRL B-3342 / UNCC 431) TaxID=512565 RepID=I0H1N2_ACTM4|nr:bifunctional 3'-5' exonuclease/DNA polymerase [Actinoplanes missouriensis]BAL86919.1 putative DNA polymerase I [Actinoplanes missouriensis 431]
MLVAVLPDGRLQDLRADGGPAGPPHQVADLPATIAAREAADQPRWVWASTADIYPALLRAGVRVARCHDLELTEALLLGHAGRWGEPRGVAAALARIRGLPAPPDPPRPDAEPPGFAQAALFETASAPIVEIQDLLEVYGVQQRRITETDHPGRFRMLVAAESAGALTAAEMGHTGLPWRADIHDELLRELLGAPQPVGPPRRLAELTAEINAAFGVRGLHPDSPAEVVKAFARAGIHVPNTRRWVLRGIDHPAVEPLLEFKELYRIWTAHGWSWCDAWVRDGRFRPEYVAGGVVSGRWATRGGGALQVPKVVRRAVVADPGWEFVVADAGQLEPRVLAAVSGDSRLARAAAAGDLYAALAADSFGGDRAKAKIALLGAMYGQTGGDAIPALAVLRRHYPVAFDYVEAAARTGENGGLVRSWLGRTCPPAHVARDAGLEPPEDVAPPPGRARGRFTRNFVIQATAAEWALVVLALLRTALSDMSAELVLFVHDEVVVHCPASSSAAVVEAVQECAARAGRMLFGDTSVRFPLDVSVVGAYADAK